MKARLGPDHQHRLGAWSGRLAYKAAYVAAKHGLVGLTKVAGVEIAEYGHHVEPICPGWVLTPLVEKQIDDLGRTQGPERGRCRDGLLGEKQPSKRFVTPEQLGGTVAFLCSPAADQITGSCHCGRWCMDRAIEISQLIQNSCR